jgi:putative ABC transport system permease protein
MAVVLLAGAGLLLRSFLAILAVDTGFQAERVLTFGVHPPAASYENEDAVRDYYARLSEHVATLPGVEASAAASWLPILGGDRTWRVEIEGLLLDPGEERSLHTRFVTPDYFRAMGISLHRGRDFTAEDRGEIPVIVINQAAASRYFPGEDPLGKQIRSVTDERVGGVVVGVVGDAPQGAVHETPQPEMFVPHGQAPRRLMTMVVRVDGDPLAAAGTIRRGVHSLDAGVPLRDFRAMDQIVAESLSRPRFLTMLLALFAAVALVMAAIGIFGLLSFSVVQRTREIGIRMALGARPGEVIGAVVRRGLVLTVTGLGIGMVGAVLVTRFLHGVLYGIAPTDPITFATVPLLLAAVALLAAWLPARRAARVDPMVALRAE